MPCDSATLVANAATKGFQSLSDRMLMACILYQLCNGPASLTAAQVVALAQAAGYDKLSERELWECILSTLCP